MYDKETLLEVVALAVAVSKDVKDGCDKSQPAYWTAVERALEVLVSDEGTVTELLNELKRIK